MHDRNVKQTFVVSPQDGPSSTAAFAAGQINTTTTGPTDRVDSSRCSNSNARRRASISCAASPTVQRLYRDPFEEAISRRRHQSKSTEDPTAPAGALRVKKSKPSRTRPSTTSTPPSTPLPSAQRHWKTTVEATPQASALHTNDGPQFLFPTSMSETSPSVLRSSAEATNAVSATVLPSSSFQSEHALCVVVPVAPAGNTSCVSAVTKGIRLDLHCRDLTALPCLHRTPEETETHSESSEGESGNSVNNSLTCASPHGSGDTSAVHIHALNLRQNRIRSLLTPSARTNKSGSLTATASAVVVEPSLPLSTPLQFYAYVSSLDLTDNELTSIEGIEALRCLRSLRLALNRLTSLAPLWASPYVAELDVLDVSSNALTELITADDVHAWELRQVRVVTHPTQAYTTTGSYRTTKTTTNYKSMRLRVLYAANNSLRTLPSAIYTLSHLADLRLCGNEIESVPEGFPSLACLPKLARLDLSMNHLPLSVVDAITARVEGTATETSNTRCCTPPLHTQNNNNNGSESSRRHNGSSARCAQPSDKAPLTSFSPSAQRKWAIQLKISSNVPRSESGNAINAKKFEAARHTPPLLPETSQESLRSSPQRPCLTGEEAVTTPVKTAFSITASITPPRTPEERAVVIKETQTSPTKRTGIAAVSFSEVGALPKLEESVGSGNSGFNTVTAETAETQSTFESAVKRIGENVYCVNVRKWAEMVQHNLMALTESIITITGETQGAPPSFTEQELLSALSDSVDRRTGASVPSNGSGASTAGGLKNTCPRPSSTARVVAALRRCLPPANSLCFFEDTQVNSPPLLLLTGISSSVASNQQKRLLYEVLAHHIAQSCICTPKTANAMCPVWRSVKSINSDRAGRLDGVATRMASRQLNFLVSLLVVHILDSEEMKGEGEGSAANAKTSLLWSYVAWRKCWETAMSRRRVKHRNTFVFEMNGNDLTQTHSSLMGSQESSHSTQITTESRNTERLSPFACQSTPTRVLEWSRLQEARPESYTPLPAPWELLYERLHRVNASGFPSSIRSVPPIISASSGYTFLLKDCPVSLSCLLLCTVELSNMATATNNTTTAWTPTVALASTTTTTSSQAAFRRVVSAMSAASTSSSSSHSSIHRRRNFDLSQTHTHVISNAVHQQQYGQCLAQHIESEATMVAAEQVPRCALPTYSSEDVRRSQQAALLYFSQAMAQYRKGELNLNNITTTSAAQEEAPFDPTPSSEKSSVDALSVDSTAEGVLDDGNADVKSDGWGRHAVASIINSNGVADEDFIDYAPSSPPEEEEAAEAASGSYKEKVEVIAVE